MKKSVILNTEQVKRLQETGTVAVVELVKPQPTVSSKNPERFDVNFKSLYRFIGNATLEVIKSAYLEYAAPYTQGQQVYVREKWVKGCDWDGEGDMPPHQFGYQGSEWVSNGDWYDGNREDGIALTIPWKSAATMPKSAARLFLVVASVECVRVKDINDIHWSLMNGYDAMKRGWLHERQQYIVKRYGQSAWDNNAFIFITTFKIKK